jgi:hypothetical protein
MGNALYKSRIENQNTFYIQYLFPPPPPENCTLYEIMSKNVVETKKQQMTSQYGVYELHAG